MTCRVEIAATVDSRALAVALHGMPANNARRWIGDLLYEIDADLYHSIAEFIKATPDTAVECQRCHRWTNHNKPRMAVPANCDHCKAVLP